MPLWIYVHGHHSFSGQVCAKATIRVALNTVGQMVARLSGLRDGPDECVPSPAPCNTLRPPGLQGFPAFPALTRGVAATGTSAANLRKMFSGRTDTASHSYLLSIKEVSEFPQVRGVWQACVWGVPGTHCTLPVNRLACSQWTTALTAFSRPGLCEPLFVRSPSPATQVGPEVSRNLP